MNQNKVADLELLQIWRPNFIKYNMVCFQDDMSFIILLHYTN